MKLNPQDYKPKNEVIHQQVKKRVPFTVVDIGGREEMAKFRKSEALRMAEEDVKSAKRADERRTRAIEIAMGERAKPAYEVRPAAPHSHVITPPLFEYYEEAPAFQPPAKPSFFARMKNAIGRWAKDLWDSAFPA